MLVTVDGQPTGIIALADTIKEHSAEAIARRVGIDQKKRAGGGAA
ncbi:MAG: hypothetical protein A4E53_00227 [Pelotomaculum sp. PtaB.Bin104]|nr:MAG: hypothetical protein A4E53_00227 [Pelotomaculum sp. PtaB.Bin104]